MRSVSPDNATMKSVSFCNWKREKEEEEDKINNKKAAKSYVGSIGRLAPAVPSLIALTREAQSVASPPFSQSQGRRRRNNPFRILFLLPNRQYLCCEIEIHISCRVLLRSHIVRRDMYMYICPGTGARASSHVHHGRRAHSRGRRRAQSANRFSM